jgi:hypothetical protein
VKAASKIRKVASFSSGAATAKKASPVDDAKHKQNLEFVKHTQQQKQAAASSAPAPKSDTEAKLTMLFNQLESLPENSPEYNKTRQELDKLIFVV